MAEQAARRLPAQANPLAHLQMFHLQPSRGDGAYDFVAWHQRKGAKSQHVVDHRDIGRTDVAIVHGDLDLFGSQRTGIVFEREEGRASRKPRVAFDSRMRIHNGVSANGPARVLQRHLGYGPVDVMTLNRTFTIAGAHCSVAAATISIGVGARRVSEPTTELLCKIRVVAEAAGIGNLAERLACLCQCPAMQKPYGVIQTKRLDEIAAGRAPEREELLEVAYGNPQFGCYVTRAEIWIGKAIHNDLADTSKQPVGMAGGGPGVGRRK